MNELLFYLCGLLQILKQSVKNGNNMQFHGLGVFILAITCCHTHINIDAKTDKKKKTDQLDELPEIKPHWLQGNMRFSENMNVSFEEHYKRMKGLRFCKFWNFQEQRLFVLDPDVCSKIMISDFEHFGYVPFVPKEYCDVSNEIFGF